jgi:hypothetical protein
VAASGPQPRAVLRLHQAGVRHERRGEARDDPLAVADADPQAHEGRRPARRLAGIALDHPADVSRRIVDVPASVGAAGP